MEKPSYSNRYESTFIYLADNEIDIYINFLYSEN